MDKNSRKELRKLVLHKAFELKEKEYVEVVESVLNPRERRLLKMRIDNLTYEKIGTEFGITRTRAHEICTKALDKIIKHMIWTSE